MIYTAVACLDVNKDKVLMVEKKNGPDAVRGYWNFIGGKFKPGVDRTMQDCARREFLEETGIAIPGPLKHRVLLSGQGWCVHFFLLVGDYHATNKAVNDVGEIMGWIRSDQLGTPKCEALCVPNLRWIWPLMIDKAITGPTQVFDNS